MATALKFGPADHGRKVSAEELQTAEYQEGYSYEIIDGRLYVSPLPNLPEDCIEKWLLFKLGVYSQTHRDVVNYVTDKARVFVPDREDLTVPEPDVALYRDFPFHLPRSERRWEDISPFLVAEILSSDADKDLVRNVELYLQVPSIREYWIIDSREDPDEPTMTVHRRHGRRWRSPITVRFGQTYTTKLLPDFELVLNPEADPHV